MLVLIFQYSFFLYCLFFTSRFLSKQLITKIPHKTNVVRQELIYYYCVSMSTQCGAKKIGYVMSRILLNRFLEIWNCPTVIHVYDKRKWR